MEYWNSGKRKRLGLKCVQSKFKRVTSEKQLRNWAEQTKSGGTRTDKLHRITKFTLEQFSNAVQTNLMVHDNDLRRWAIQASMQENLESFKASRYWLWTFKGTYNIVSRKVTTFVTSGATTRDQNLHHQCTVFINNVRP